MEGLYFSLLSLVLISSVQGYYYTCRVPGIYSPINVGQTFRHPKNPCVVCLCCEGDPRPFYTCRKRHCPYQPCGISKQTEYSEDGCCRECCEACKHETCKKNLNCPVKAYKHDSCCLSCGCDYHGIAVPRGKFGHRCEKCVCKANGETKCNRPDCPPDKLPCINPSFDGSCNYICPTGDNTCRRSEVIIPPNTLIAKRRKICMCNNFWYPRAFCFTPRHGKRIQRLKNHFCVDVPSFDHVMENPLLQYYPWY